VKEIPNKCCICGKKFFPYSSNQRYCSQYCRDELREDNNEFRRMIKTNKLEGTIPCIVCGFSETIDLHHEGRKTYVLCPNHHALITRGIKKFEDYELEYT